LLPPQRTSGLSELTVSPEFIRHRLLKCVKSALGMDDAGDR
jgi:hypothetical protein